MKKNLTLLCIALFSVCIASAQIEKGTVLIGGEISGNSLKTDYSNSQISSKSTNLFINPSIGVAVKQNGILGISFGFSHYNQKGYYDGSQYRNSKANYYSPAIFYRQYKNLAKDFYFIMEADAGFSYSKQTDTDTLGKTLLTYKVTGGQLSLMPGIAYKICKNLHIEILIPSFVSVGYTVQKTNNLNYPGSTSKGFGVRTSLNGSNLDFLGVGFKYFIQRKKA